MSLPAFGPHSSDYRNRVDFHPSIFINTPASAREGLVPKATKQITATAEWEYHTLGEMLAAKYVYVLSLPRPATVYRRDNSALCIDKGAYPDVETQSADLIQVRGRKLWYFRW